MTRRSRLKSSGQRRRLHGRRLSGLRRTLRSKHVWLLVYQVVMAIRWAQHDRWLVGIDNWLMLCRRRINRNASRA